jgi:hypothetical protein
MVDSVTDPGDIQVPATTAAGYGSLHIATTQEDAASARVSAGAATPQSLGVDQASFDKFFNDGEFDYASYGKEQAFKAKGKTEGADATGGEPAATKDGDTQAPDTAAAQDAVSNAGLNWDTLSQSVSENGDITKEDRAALVKIGIPNNIIDTHINAVHGQTQNLIDTVISGIGGQATFDAVFDALQEHPMELRNKIDGLLQDPDTREAGINLAFHKSGVQRPVADGARAQVVPVTGARASRSSPAQQGLGYKTFEEQAAAQSDPRYKNDAAYRGAVMAKIAVSQYNVNPRAHRGGL